MAAANPPAPLPDRTVRFASGDVRYLGPMSPDILVLGLDAEGYVVVRAHGMDYALTACCQASAKGCGPYSDDDEGYIGCRACYAEVDPKLGGEPDPIVDAAVEVLSPPAPTDSGDAPAPPVTEPTAVAPASPKEKKMSRSKATPAAEQFAALGLTDPAAWSPAMNLAVKQKWANLPVDRKVDDLRAELAAVEVAKTPDAAALLAGNAAGATEPCYAAATDQAAADVEAARLKRNAKVNAWRVRNQIQAALDARAMKFAAMRAGRGKVDADLPQTGAAFVATATGLLAGAGAR